MSGTPGWGNGRPNRNTAGVDVVGHRRGRIHRIERGREPQRGRAHRHRRQRRARQRRQMAQSRKRQLADFVPPADLLRWLDGRKLDAVIHLGAISSNHGDATATSSIETNFRLSLRLLDWCATTRTPFIYASSAATYGDGEQGLPTTGRPPRCKRLKPMNLYGWSKHLFDLAVVERVARKEQAAAAMGRAEVLQRVRPERIPQGRDDEPRRQALRRRQGRQADAAVQVAPRRHRRRRAEARFHLRRRRGRRGALAHRDAVGVGHLQRRHRQGAQLPRPDHRHVRGARPRAGDRIRRHAGVDPRQLPVFHPGRDRQICAAPATMPASPRSKRR